MPGIDPVDLEGFLDRILAVQMREDHIRGAAVSVVQDGELILAKGYGYTDAEGLTPVRPETTLFRAGSVAKPFTATAVMQLVERRVASLTTDINNYAYVLKLPRTYAQPITLAHLLTHTAGFEECCLNLVDQVNLLPLYLYLPDAMPNWLRSGRPAHRGHQRHTLRRIHVLAGPAATRYAQQQLRAAPAESPGAPALGRFPLLGRRLS
jgi:CubicO group peptidase (beta-lactamase class C family)